MTFGEKFRAEREKKKLNQKEVADALGLHVRMITKYENGHSFPRTREAYKRIADFFGVSVNYLMTEEESFTVQAVERHGDRAMKQARELVDGISSLFAGGELSERDRDAVMKELQDIYWKAKERNAAKYTPTRSKDEP